MSPQISLDDLAVAALVVGADGTVEAANAAAAELAGQPVARLVGTPVDALLVPAPTRAPSGAVDVKGQELCLHGAEGREVAVVAYSRPRAGEAGGPVSGVVVLRRLEGVDAAGAPTGPSGMEVISTVSHELRSPLTSVKGYASLLLSRWERLSDEQKKAMLEQVHHDADRVTRLVNELLDISRLETGHLQLRFETVVLPVLASSVVDKVAMEYPELDCRIDFAEEFPPVRADPDKVEQVLTNLVENAAKYASLEGMTVSGTVAGDSVSVAVADTGEGIPEVDLPHVFTKFYRREQGRPSGSGLGLWISRGLVEAHGGSLDAHSVVGRGSVFRFTLPLDGHRRARPS
ncbi:MAG: HAMP domain-containing histidine kinase [Actinomycetota bacterium]|nr:HAMP domain-containing histidine kinase [Actinomycetota bacterium]